MWCVVVLICFCILNVSSSLRDEPLVQTKVGLIKGLYASDGNYTMFLGIPYAQIDPNNPFGDHVTQSPFETTYEAFDGNAKCPQDRGRLRNNKQTNELDCLILNIFVPSSASVENPLPVMIVIHGGAFQSGSSIISGLSYILKHEVIVVSINYRVGIYGFMCLDIPEVPGNAGLKDQAAAIKWVNDHIADFGGDVKSITLVGGSAGAASVDLQLRYNKEADFHKVILQSGTAAGSWAIQPPDYESAIKLAAKLGFQTSDSLAAVKFLGTQVPSTVTAVAKELVIEGWPCVEKEFLNVNRFVEDYARNLKIPRVKNTPIIIGFNNDEWLLRYVNHPPEYFETLTIFEDNLLEAFNFTDAELQEAVKIIKTFYLGDDPLSLEKRREIANFDTDFNFITPTETAINQYLENGATAIYHYVFPYVGRRNNAKVRANSTLGGAFHGDENGYLFDSELLEEPNEEDQLMIDRLTTMWSNLAKYGNPTPEQTELLPVKWETVTKTKRTYLELDRELSLRNTPFHDRVAFWDLVYLRYQTKQWGYKSKTNDML